MKYYIIELYGADDSYKTTISYASYKSYITCESSRACEPAGSYATYAATGTGEISKGHKMHYDIKN